MELVHKQQVEITIASGATSNTGSLSGFTTLGKMVPIRYSVNMDANTNVMSRCDFKVEVTSTSVVTVTRGASGTACTVIVDVIECSDDTTVIKGSWTLSAAGNDDNTISSVTMADAFVVFSRMCTATGVLQPNAQQVSCELQSATNVRFNVNTGTNTHSGVFYVMEDSSLTVYRGTTAVTATTGTVTIGGTVVLAETFCTCSVNTSETQYEDEGHGYLELTSTTQGTFHCGYSSGGGPLNAVWQVIEDSDLTVQRFSAKRTATGSGSQTITAVDDIDFTVIMPGCRPTNNASSLYDNAADMSARSCNYELTTTTNVDWTKEANNGSWAFEVVEFPEVTASGPTITNADDEDFTLTETNITVTGTAFGTQTGSADLELGDNATYASATKVSQSIDSWAATSIQFDVTIGTLDQEQLWLYVTDSTGAVSAAYEVHVEATPTITNAGDELFETDETNITLTGTVFRATQGTGKLELVNNSVYASGTKVTQSIDTWGDLSIQFDLTIGGLTEIDLWLFATNSLGHVSAGYSVQVYRTPTITDIEDEIFTAAEKGIILDGTYLQSSQGSGKVELTDNVVYASGTKVAQTINSWGNLQIDFDLVIGSHSQSDLYIFATNDIGEVSAGTAVTVTGLPITGGLWKESSIQASITSVGLDTTVFLISDED